MNLNKNINKHQPIQQQWFSILFQLINSFPIEFFINWTYFNIFYVMYFGTYIAFLLFFIILSKDKIACNILIVWYLLSYYETYSALCVSGLYNQNALLTYVVKTQLLVILCHLLIQLLWLICVSDYLRPSCNFYCFGKEVLQVG